MPPNYRGSGPMGTGGVLPPSGAAGSPAGRATTPLGTGQTHPLARDPETEALHELGLDLLGLALDVGGIFEPTPFCDGASALLSLGRGRWLDAAISGVSMVPYIGDLAKAGKLPRYLRSVEKAVQLADRSKAAAKALLPGFEKLKAALDLLPVGANKQLDRIRVEVASFVARHGGRKIITELPDISARFEFKTIEEGDRIIKTASGKLGVPGKVKSYRKAEPAAEGAARKSVSSGSGDHAGHLIGDQFGAPSGAANRLGLGTENLSLQNAKMNSNGTWYKLEEEWAAKLKEGHGIEVTVSDFYRKGEVRPYKRKVTGTETLPDGTRKTFNAEEDMGEVIYGNFHTEASRAKQGIPPTKLDGTPAKVIPFPTKPPM